MIKVNHTCSNVRLGALALAVALVSGCKYTDRVSVSSAGDEANDLSVNPSISADGRYVAFSSSASNLVAGDTNNTSDVFVHDTQTGTITRVSESRTGDDANGFNEQPSISADGRYVAFYSSASDLVAGDMNFTADIFVHDTQTGTTMRVSESSAGDEADSFSIEPSISADGRYVAFHSFASNLVAEDTSWISDIFVHDTQAGTTTRVNVSSAGDEAAGFSFNPSISADGRYVAFDSDASNLVVGDTNSYPDIFVHDTQTGATTRVSVSSAGEQADHRSINPSISAGGRYVVFHSLASNLVLGDTNATEDIFVHDIQTGTTTRVSESSAGAEANGPSIAPSISAAGRYVAFNSGASNLVAEDTNGEYDIFVHDTQTSTTTRVSESSAGYGADDGSLEPSISADGRYVAFTSYASNLVAGDTNGRTDIIIRSIPNPTVASVIPDHLPIGATTSVEIKGTDFLPGTTVIGPGSYSNITVVDENTLTFDITVPSTAQPGARNLVISVLGKGPGALRGSSAICANCVTFQ